jgi:lipopolysaccharide export system protein LptA
MKKGSVFFLLLFIFLSSFAQAQETVADSTSKEPVQILRAKNFYWKRIDPVTELKILSGNVLLKQGTALFYCDSCVVNSTAHIFEAFGNVHINDHDTTNIYSDYLKYLTNTKIAYFNGHVKMSDGHATLTTSDLQYDVNTKIGTYTNGGTVVNKKSVLTSREGVYYSDLRDVYFKTNVELKDPAYYLKTDSLLYNTETQIARFIAETYMKDSSGRIIRTKDGYYDMVRRHAEFYSRTIVEDGSTLASSDRMASDDSTGIIQMEGNAVLKDTAKGQTIISGTIYHDKKTDASLATKKPLMIIKQDEDSIYITADTLFSARLTDLYKNDSAKLATFHFKENDSTNRYFEAYRHVRVFSDSVQSVSDSLFYSFKDSTFHLFYDPVVWNKKSQITGDTIYLYTKNKKASRIQTIENSFIVNEVEHNVYNQIKSSRMDGYFKEGSLDSVRAKGLAESVYFIQDNDSAYTSVNQTKSDAIDIYFEKGELYKVIFRSDLKGTLYPLSQKQPDEMKLANFKWLINRRPKTKYEMFE